MPIPLRAGSTGPDVSRVETRLTGLGLYSGAVDASFGPQLETAVRAFQRSVGLPADGVIGEQTWSALFPVETTQPPASGPLLSAPLATRCLALTGTFETSASFPDCFAGLTGDFDGQGLSYGVIQWNIGQGTLQPLFSDLLEAHPDLARQIFGGQFGDLRTMLAASRADQLAWARGIQDTVKHLVLDPWRSAFVNLARTPEFQAIETTRAATYRQTGLELCTRFGVHSERAVALMFDIAVQNGTIGAAAEALIRQDFAVIPADATDAEVQKLRSVANRRAEAANPRFIEDVRVRKLTIANGSGNVHGRAYDLAAQFGITLDPADLF